MPGTTTEEIGQLVDSRFSIDDYEHLPDDGLRYQILDGDLVMTPAPSTEHQRISRRLQFLLYTALEQNGKAEVFDAPFDVELDRYTVVQPDLVVVLAAHRERLTARRLVGPPDLVVEILSSSTAACDQTIKKRIFARFGVTYYWIVDPEERSITEYTLEGQAYRLSRVAREPEPFQPQAFDELTISLTEVFFSPTGLS